MARLFIIIVFTSFSNTLFAQKAKKVKFDLIYEVLSTGITPHATLRCILPGNIEKVQTVRGITFSKQPDTVFTKGDNVYAEYYLSNLSSRKTEVITISFIMDLYQKAFCCLTETDESCDTTRYLKPEKHIESDDPIIKAVASKLKTSTVLKTIERTYEFTRNRITYTYTPRALGAKKAYEQRSGDCTEFADLFVALCRANGIPARGIDGYTASSDNSANHNWAEVYVEKYGWVRVDPSRNSLKKLRNEYVQISNVRNDDLGSFYLFAYGGDRLEVAVRLNPKTWFF